MKEMRTLITLCVLLGCLNPFAIGADWKSSIKNLILGNNNSVLYLQYLGEGIEETHSYSIQVMFRHQGKLPVVLQRELNLEIKPQEVYKFGFSLTPGNYEVSVDITNLKTSEHTRLGTMPFQAAISKNVLSVSDIFLTYSPISNPQAAVPILDVNILPDKEHLSFMLELYGNEKVEFTIRSVLYQRLKNQSTPKIDTWLDKQKTNRILQMKGSRSTIRELLDISNLTEGDYLVQIMVYRNAELLFHPSAAFTIEGNTRQQIFENLGTSIDQMRYIIPEQGLDSLRNIDGELQRERSFRQTWARLYGDEADREMIAYFKKIYEIDEIMAEDGEDWTSDRAMIYLQYGEPSKTQIQHKDKSFERWTYVQYDLSFLFEKRNQQYLLVE